MTLLLYVLIGLDNDLLDSFLDWVNGELEYLDQQEIMTKRGMLKVNQSGADSPFNASKMIQDFEAFVQYDGVAEEDAEEGLTTITIDASVDEDAIARIEMCHQEVISVEQ